MAVLVVITPKNEKELVILRASLNVIQPISKMNLNGPIAFKMYEADNEVEMNHKLDILCEASGVDFSYKFQFE